MMLAFAFITLLLTSTLILSATMQALHQEGVEQLQNIEYTSMNLASTTLYSTELYGNDTLKYYLDPLVNLESDYKTAWGRDTCDPRLTFDAEKTQIYDSGIDLGSNNISTDLEVRNSIAYLSADGTNAASSDLYIVDMTNPNLPSIVSTLNTGPGISALEIAGPYIYVANLSTTNQLQVIDITDRTSPILLAKFKLPLPHASSTPPLATSIFYSRGLVYLGTQKWEGNEFTVIDVTNPATPQYLGGFETNTQINSIYVRDGYAYVAASDIGQMRILDVRNPFSITQISGFSPSGWETQQGKILSYFEKEVSLGRTTGGFNVVGNHEIFTFSTTTALENSHDIPGGVYGLISRPPLVYLATHAPGREFQIWEKDLTTEVFEAPLGFQPTGMSCDNNMIYFSTGNQKGVAALKIN